MAGFIVHPSYYGAIILLPETELGMMMLTVAECGETGIFSQL